MSDPGGPAVAETVTRPAAAGPGPATEARRRGRARPRPSADVTTWPRVAVARVYEARVDAGEFRVLVDRIWPRGMSRDRADLDAWCREIAPSTALRRWYRHDPDRFTGFVRRYRHELREPGPATALDRLRDLAAERPLVLVTATRRVEISAAAVLADLLTSRDRDSTRWPVPVR